MLAGEQHELPAPVAAGRLHVCVCGRVGSHHWQAIGEVRQGAHVVRLGVDDQPALLEAEVATGDAERLADERVGAVGADDQRARTVRVSPPVRQPARLVLRHAPDGQLHAVVGLGQLLGDPPALDGDAGLGTALPSSARSSSGWKNM